MMYFFANKFDIIGKVFVVILLCCKFSYEQDKKQSPPGQVCGSGEFDCGDENINFTCIDLHKVCDSRRDCKNGEDESNCPKKDGSCPPPTISQHMTYKLNYTPAAKDAGKRIPEHVQGIFTCDPGYANEHGNSMISTCIQNEWNPPIFKCLKPCQELNTIKMQQSCFVGQEQVDCNKQLLEGTYAAISCQEAFHVPNHETTVCQKDGVWSIRPEDIKCHPVCGHCSNDTMEMLKGKDFPWRVLISETINKSEDSRNFFSGTLIDDTLILTDRRAFNNSMKSENFIITVNDDVGSWGPLRSYKVKDIHYADKNQSSNGAGSLAIFETVDDIEFGFTVFPICIDKSHSKRQQGMENETAQIVTVGNLDDNKELDRDNVTILTVIYLNDGICLKLSDQRKLYTDQFCGLVNGTLSDADRGTGLVRGDPNKKLYFLEGVFGLYAEPSKMAMFTFISNYVDWVDEIRKKVKPVHSVFHQQKQNHLAPISDMLMLFVLLSFVILLAMFLRIR